MAGLPEDMEEQRLRDIFLNYGTVVRCRVLPANGMQDRAGLVQMADVAQAQWLVDNLNSNIPTGLDRPIRIAFSSSKGGKGQANRSSPYGCGGGDPLMPGNLSGVEIKVATHTNDTGNKLWIGQIPSGTSQDAVAAEFSKYGPVENVYVRDDGKVAGRMWGFVTFVQASAASAVLEAYQAGTFAAAAMGQNACVGVAPPPPPQPMFYTEAPLQVRVSGKDNNPCKLWIGSIPTWVSQQDVKSEFSKFGEVVDVFVKDDGKKMGQMWGFVTMSEASQAAAAVTAFNQQIVFKAPASQAASWGMPGGMPGGMSMAAQMAAQEAASAGMMPNQQHPCMGQDPAAMMHHPSAPSMGHDPAAMMQQAAASAAMHDHAAMMHHAQSFGMVQESHPGMMQQCAAGMVPHPPGAVAQHSAMGMMSQEQAAMMQQSAASLQQESAAAMQHQQQHAAQLALTQEAMTHQPDMRQDTQAVASAPATSQEAVREATPKDAAPAAPAGESQSGAAAAAQPSFSAEEAAKAALDDEDVAALGLDEDSLAALGALSALAGAC